MPSKSKPSFWQSVTHAPSKSYSQAAPVHPSKLGSSSRRQPPPDEFSYSSRSGYSYADDAIDPYSRRRGEQDEWEERRKPRSKSMVGDRDHGWDYEGRTGSRRNYSDDDNPDAYSSSNEDNEDRSHHRRRRRDQHRRAASPSSSSVSSSFSYREHLSRSYLPTTATKQQLIQPSPQYALPAPSLSASTSLQPSLDSSGGAAYAPPKLEISSESESEAFYTPSSSPRPSGLLDSVSTSVPATIPTTGFAGLPLGLGPVVSVQERAYLSPPQPPAPTLPSTPTGPYLTLQPPTPTPVPIASPSSSISTPTGSSSTFFGTEDDALDPNLIGREIMPPPLLREGIPPPLIHPVKRLTHESVYDGIQPEGHGSVGWEAREDEPTPATAMGGMQGKMSDEAYSGVMLSPVGEEEEEAPYFSNWNLLGANGAGEQRLDPSQPQQYKPLRVSPPGSTLSGAHLLLPRSALITRPDSALSAASSVSRYSQTSYRSEMEAPSPAILDTTLQALTIGGGGSGDSSPVESRSGNYSPYGHANGQRRGSEGSAVNTAVEEWTPPSVYPSTLPPLTTSSQYRSSPILSSPSNTPFASHSPSYNSASPSRSTSPSPTFTSPHNTPFLPRPTSTLMNTFEMAGSYPSAPPSVVSDFGGGGGRKSTRSLYSYGGRKKASSVIDDDGRGWRGSSGGSDIGGKKRTRSEIGVEGVSRMSLPQVMGRELGEGSSLSGGAGYTSLTLPSGAYRPSKSPSRYVSKVSYNTLGIPDSTMATIMITSSSIPTNSASTSVLRRPSTSSTSSPTSSFLLTPPIAASFTSHLPPPKKLSSTSLLVRVWAVALDAYDAFAARDAGKGFVPGRSFVGKVVEWGDGVKGFSKGDWVFGLLSAKRSGALSEFIEIERRYLTLAPPIGHLASDHDPGLTLEDIASLPILGVSAHRSVGSVLKGSRALILLGDSPTAEDRTVPCAPDWGVGILAAQELVARGVVVVIQVSAELGESWVRSFVPGVREGHVRVGDPVEVVHGEHEGSFDFVLDCGGGRRVYDASRRIMITGGRFTSLKGDMSEPLSSEGVSTKNSMRSLRRTFVKKDKKHIDYNVVSPSGSGPMVDHMGDDIRDILEWITATKIYRPPRVEKVVPFERAADAFEVVARGKAKASARYKCEEEVWGVRLVS